MRLETSTPDQAAELAQFFKRFPVQGHVELLIDRSKDFFGVSRIQSDTNLTYTLRDDDNRDLLGVVSFAIAETLVAGKPARVAFGRDLRILETRKAVLGWSQHFLPVLEEVKRVFNVDHFVSTINMAETKAMNAFLRPRPGKRPFPRYFLHRRFNLVSLHGRFPWAASPLKSIRIRRGSAHLSDALGDYIARKSKDRDFSLTSTPQAFHDLLERWEGLRMDDFLVAIDGKDNIIGCCAPWNAASLEELIPLKYSLMGHNFRQFLKFGQALRWTRPMTKPVHRLGLEAGLHFRHLNFLHADNEDIFETLAWMAFEEAANNEFLVYAQARSDLHLRRPLSWVSAQMPFGFYTLLPPEAETPEFLHPAQDRPIAIEPFFVA